MRRAAKKDSNHAQIVRELRQAGASVLELYQLGCGCPDLLVAMYGWQVLVEVKDSKGKLTPDEQLFFDTWPWYLCIVARTSEEVIRHMEDNAP